VCGICGGSGSGKTTLTSHLLDRLGPERVSLLGFDAYYRDQSHRTPVERSLVNYDHPDSLDHELFAHHLDELRHGRDVDVPVYDFGTHTRTNDHRRIDAHPVVVVEGILLFAFAEIIERIDVRVFMDIPQEVRLERRLRRDVVERGREPDDVRRQFTTTVAPMHDEYVQPHRERATRVFRLGDPYETIAAELAGELSAVSPQA
jgi:uridine kinase